MSARRRLLGTILAVGLLSGASSTGCATYSDKTAAARGSLQRGDLEGSVKELNRYLKVRKKDQLPNKWKKNTALAVLERGTVLQAMREYKLSARDITAAEKELEFLDLARDTAGKIGKYIYSDSATKYKTSPTEKLSINAVNLLNYLTRGDLQGSKIEARRFTVMRKYLHDYDPEHEHGAFGSYLAGYVSERLGNANEALRYYNEALQERDFDTLREPIARLSQRGSFRSPRINEYLGVAETSARAKPFVPSSFPDRTLLAAPAPEVQRPEKAPAEPASAPAQPEEGAATGEEPPKQTEPAPKVAPAKQPKPKPAPEKVLTEVIVVVKTGRVPYKEPRRIPIGAAVGLAGAFITGDPTILQYTLFKVVVYPELVPSRSLFDEARLRIDGKPAPIELASDLASEIVREYEEIKPKIIGAALTRMIFRAAAAEGARAAGKQSSEQGALIGFLAAAALEGTLVALDKPDTRSWTTLPAQVYIGRAKVAPGTHSIQVTTLGPGGRQTHRTKVSVPKGEFVVLDVTTLR